MRTSLDILGAHYLTSQHVDEIVDYYSWALAPVSPKASHNQEPASDSGGRHAPVLGFA